MSSVQAERDRLIVMYISGEEINHNDYYLFTFLLFAYQECDNVLLSTYFMLPPSSKDLSH